MTAIETPHAVTRTDRLPVLQTVAARTLDVLARRAGSGPSPDLVQIAELDLALTAGVFRIARSPLYGPGAARMPVAVAIERLGAERMTALVGGLERVQEAGSSAGIEIAARRWTCALAVAAAVRWLANQGDYDDPAEAYLTGLVAGHVMAVGDPAGSGAASIAATFRFGPRVETALAEHPADARRAAAAGDESAMQLRELLRLACSIVSALGFGDPARPAPPGTLEHGAAAGVEEAIALELAHATSLLRLPAGAPQDFAARLVAEERRLCSAAPALAAARADASDPPPSGLLRLVAVYDALALLRPETAVRAPAIHDILDGGLAAFHESLRFDRIVFFERDPARAHVMRVRQVHCRSDLPRDWTVLSAEVPADPHSTLARAADLRRGAAIRTGGHRADAALLLLLGAPDAAASPIWANSGAVGVVVADHAVHRRVPDDEDVAALGIASGLLGLLLENAARMAEAVHLRALAEKDELTGINNRRCILDILRREVDRARRYGKQLSVALVDVDHFKRWNDLHGHPVGDMVLASVAQLISSVGREIDAYGRYGGEEFLIVLPETSAEHAMIYAERLRATIEAHGLELSQRFPGTSLTVSIGVTQVYPRGDDDRALVARADAALYHAKERGRNRVCVDDETPLSPPPAPAVRPTRT